MARWPHTKNVLSSIPPSGQKASEEFFANEGVVCNNTVFSHMSWIIVIKVVIYVSSGFRVGYLLFRRPVVEMSRASRLQCKECFEC